MDVNAITREPTRQKTQPAKPGKTGVKPRVDRTNGRWNAGVIYGVSLITRGEALGHQRWIDREMVAQVTDAVEAAGEVGLKSRFTHPDMSADGLFSKLGRLTDARTTEDGNQSLADLHLYEAAHTTPDGDLAGHVMDLAEQDPEGFGFSIVFNRDRDSEKKFTEANGGDKFLSPDSDNVHNYPHARIKRLWAADAVDDPAANPKGLFHKSNDVFEDAERFAGYLFGVDNEKPELVSLDIDPDRARLFVTRFLDSHNLELRSKEITTMAIDKQAAKSKATADAATAPKKEPTEANEGNKETSLPSVPPAASPADQAAEPAAATPAVSEGLGQKFLAAFGDKGGVWFAQGKTFDEARDLHVADLKAQLEASHADKAALAQANKELKTQLTAGRGETSPVSFSPADGDPQAAKVGKHARTLGPNLARFAAGIRFAPSSNGSNNGPPHNN